MGPHKNIDAQIELARNLEVDHAIALLESGQTRLIEGAKMFKQARVRIGYQT